MGFPFIHPIADITAKTRQLLISSVCSQKMRRLRRAMTFAAIGFISAGVWEIFFAA